MFGVINIYYPYSDLEGVFQKEPLIEVFLGDESLSRVGYRGAGLLLADPGDSRFPLDKEL